MNFDMLVTRLYLRKILLTLITPQYHVSYKLFIFKQRTKYDHFVNYIFFIIISLIILK